jgi:Protein of unknown function (DUF2865)
MGKTRLCENSDDRRRPLPLLRSRVVRALAAATQDRAVCALGGLGFILLAAALASALAQTSGCARCGAVPSSPIMRAETPLRMVSREEAPRREARRESIWRRIAGGGPYTVCVRTCDGGFFPVTYFGARSRADTLEEVCRSLCPNAEVKLYSFPLGGTIDEAVSSTGEPYDRLPNAHKFEQSYDSSCSCRRAGESWAEALANAEAKYGHNAHDVLVTPEKSAEMSRPIEDAKTIAARVSLIKADAATMVDASDPPELDLDINGVDTKLSAAAASMSRETSGIKGESAQSRAIYRLNQGRMVEEKGPDGSPRRVRIVGPTF